MPGTSASDTMLIFFVSSGVHERSLAFVLGFRMLHLGVGRHCTLLTLCLLVVLCCVVEFPLRKVALSLRYPV